MSRLSCLYSSYVIGVVVDLESSSESTTAGLGFALEAPLLFLAPPWAPLLPPAPPEDPALEEAPPEGPPPLDWRFLERIVSSINWFTCKEVRRVKLSLLSCFSFASAFFLSFSLF